MFSFNFESAALRITVDLLLQAILFITTVAAMWLITTPGYVKAGCIVGLCSQPLWFIATWRARQGGMFLVACVQTGFWLRGIVAYS
jgi:hypothetical protein